MEAVSYYDNQQYFKLSFVYNTHPKLRHIQNVQTKHGKSFASNAYFELSIQTYCSTLALVG